jgi:hypothetical protein
MATRRNLSKQGRDKRSARRPVPMDDDEALGDELIRQAREGHAEFLAGWKKFMKQLGIRGKPIGAKKLRARMIQAGIDSQSNEFSRGIIAMREE